MNQMVPVHWLQAKSPSPTKPADTPKPKASATRGGSPSTTKKGAKAPPTKKGAKASPKPAAAAAASADALKLGVDPTAPGDEVEQEVGSAAAYCLSKLSEQLHTGADRCLLPAHTNASRLWCCSVVVQSLRQMELKQCIPGLQLTSKGH